MNVNQFKEAWEYLVHKSERKRLPYEHVVMYSGGVGSFCTALRVVERYGQDNVCLLFTDTLIEHETLYEFLRESQRVLGCRLYRVADGRTPWELFEDVRFIGNNRVPVCSRVLKQETARKWVEKHFLPDEVTLYIGIDWSEIHRLEGAQKGWTPYKVEAPMTEEPYLDKHDMLELAAAKGIQIPDLYQKGFAHNNCGGTCVRAGVTHWKQVLETYPERYAEWEQNETRLREKLGQGQILKDYTLTELREAVERGDELPEFDWGGCACMISFDE